MPQGKKLIDLLTQEELNEIIEMYQSNVSLRQIAEKTHHSRISLTQMLEDLSIKTIKGNHYRYYTFNYNFFDKIDNELSAYWLGFMYADGCVLPVNKYGQQNFKIQIDIKDEELLEKFQKDINSTYPIRYDKSRIEYGIVQCIQSLRSQKTVDDLKKLGCVENKSLILKFPTSEQVPDEFIYHFIRGYFDGDGSISSYQKKETHFPSYQICFVGTESFIKTLQDKWLPYGSVIRDKRKTNSWYLSINGNRQVIKVYNLLYNNATRYMQRKYNVFQPLIEKYRETEGT